MKRERRKGGSLPENVERPARGRLRRTRDSGALPDAAPSRKSRLDETLSRRTDRRPVPQPR
jgi:hypothetical protein